MPAKPGERIPLVLYGLELLSTPMRCNEPVGDADRREGRLRQKHEAGEITIHHYDYAAREWRKVAPHDWQKANFDRGYLTDPDNVAFGSIAVCVIKLRPQNDHQHRIELLHQAWLSAGRPAVWARDNPSGWTTAQARDEVLKRHSQIVWHDLKRFERIPDPAIKKLMYRVTLKQLYREFGLAR